MNEHSFASRFGYCENRKDTSTTLSDSCDLILIGASVRAAATSALRLAFGLGVSIYLPTSTSAHSLPQFIVPPLNFLKQFPI